MTCSLDDLKEFFSGMADVWRCKFGGFQIRKSVDMGRYYEMERSIFYIELLKGCFVYDGEKHTRSRALSSLEEVISLIGCKERGLAECSKTRK